jgi:hypothetical protein
LDYDEIKNHYNFYKKRSKKKNQNTKDQMRKKIIHDKLGLNDEIENKYFFYKRTKKKKTEVEILKRSTYNFRGREKKKKFH